MAAILKYLNQNLLNHPENVKQVVQLRSEISLEVICEMSNFQAVIFGIIFVTIKGHTYEPQSVKTKLNEEIAKA